MFGTEEDLKVHHEEEHGKRKDPIVYNCGTCEEKYFTFVHLAEHIDQQHKPDVVEEENPVVIEALKSCDRCDFETEDVRNLNEHYAKDIHTVQNQNKSISGIECNKCLKKFDNNTSLEMHVQEDHIILKVYNCTSCDHRTTSLNEVKVHIDTSHTVVVEDPGSERNVN